MNFEQQHLNKVLVESLLSQQKKELSWRKWRFFLIFAAVILIFMLYASALKNAVGDKNIDAEKEGYVALVRVDGAIMPDSKASARQVIPALVKAFNDQSAQGVAILINSPGGTPVQSALIRERIAQLKKEFPDKKVVAIGEDMLTSGAYMVASGADDIYVNRSTVVGSIGVIVRGFGFVDAAEKLGVERRVFTAGDNKNRLDPFVPVNPADVDKMETLLQEIHEQFISLVKEGRGNRLASDDLFTGDFWTGEKAVELGLADGVGNLAGVLRKEFSVKHYIEYGGEDDFIAHFRDIISKTMTDGLNAVAGQQGLLAM